MNPGDTAGPGIIHHGEFQFSHALELCLSLINLLGIEPCNLHQDTIFPLRADDRFAESKLVHAFADDLDRLLKGGGVDLCAGLRDEFDEKRCPALQIEPKTDFLRRWPNLLKAECGKQNCQDQAEPALPQSDLGGKIPAE